jgi:cellulose synthase/poly-beta-1,6-N-acetylglucosamine synthase-like glycosyltransferase
MISILITAFKEQKTIAKCIDCIANQQYSGIPNDFEILLACPDKETHEAALEQISKLNIKDKFKFITDPGKGKPTALNMLMDKAEGDIWIFTDGDVYFGPKAVEKLLEPFKNEDVTLVTGRPKSEDYRNSMMGYFGHLLSDAAHHKRTIDLTRNAVGKSLAFIKKREFFPVSGYIYAIKKTDIRFPADCLVDDAYISYVVFNSGGKIEYAPEAIAFVKYPTNLKDYFKQKARSTGGYIQLWEYNIIKPTTKTRSFYLELEYFWFPINYAKNIRELVWSLLLYPIRLYLWLKIYWDRKIIKKDFVKTWVRIESTK